MKHLEENEVKVKTEMGWSEEIDLPNIKSIGDLKRANRIFSKLEKENPKKNANNQQKDPVVGMVKDLFLPEVQRRVFYCLNRYFTDNYDWSNRTDFSVFINNATQNTIDLETECKNSYISGFAEEDRPVANDLFEDLYEDAFDIVGHNIGKGEVVFPIFFKNVSMKAGKGNGDLVCNAGTVDVKYGESGSFGYTKSGGTETEPVKKAKKQVIALLKNVNYLLFISRNKTKVRAIAKGRTRGIFGKNSPFRFRDKKSRTGDLAIWLNESQEPDAKLDIGDQNMNTTKGFRMRRMNENFNKDNWCAPSVSELARDLEEAVKYLWEYRNEGGCYHWPIYFDDAGQEWDIVLGWLGGFDPNDTDIYVDEDGHAICCEVAYQTKNNAMQTDMEFDFTLPYDEESGEVYGNSLSISRNEDYEWLAKELLTSGKELVETFAVVDDDEDLEESRHPSGRMLKESTGFSWNRGKFDMEDLIRYIDGNTGVQFDLNGEEEDDDDVVVSWLYDAELDDGSSLTLIRNKDKSEDTLIFEGEDDTIKIDFKKDSQEKCSKILNKILDSIRNTGEEDDDLEETRHPRGRTLREATEFVGLQKFTKDDLKEAWNVLNNLILMDVKKGSKLEVSCYSDVNGSVDLNYMDFGFDTILRDLECMDATARSADYEVIYDDKDNDETTGHGILIKHGRIAKVY